MKEKISFYQEVIVTKSDKRPEFIGRKGIIMGISEYIDDEGNIRYGYAASIDNYPNTVCFDNDELEPTGKFYKREDFY